MQQQKITMIMINNTEDNEVLLKNVLESTKSALLALSQLEQNLIRGRFKEGVKSYEIMCKTLIGQRKWAFDKQDLKVNKNFKNIISTAHNIIDILQPYVKNLEKLTHIEGEIFFRNGQDGIETIPIDSDEKLLSDEEMVYLTVKASPQNRISYTKLRSELGWSRKKLDHVLNSLDTKIKAFKINILGSRKTVTLEG